MTIRIPLNVYTCSVHEFKDQCRGRTYNRIFVRFNINIPSPAPLPPSQEIAFTLNIDKEEAEYFTTKHKPSLAQAEYGLQIGRVQLAFAPLALARPPLHSVFSLTRHTAVLLEAVAMALVREESLLLVGETGVGKTTAVQFLAERTGRRLRVVNLNQQSDSADLLGNFRPVSMTHSLHGVRERFTAAFCSTFSSLDKAVFLAHLDTCFQTQRWTDALQLMLHSTKAGLKKLKKLKKRMNSVLGAARARTLS